MIFDSFFIFQSVVNQNLVEIKAFLSKMTIITKPFSVQT